MPCTGGIARALRALVPRSRSGPASLRSAVLRSRCAAARRTHVGFTTPNRFRVGAVVTASVPLQKTRLFSHSRGQLAPTAVTTRRLPPAWQACRPAPTGA